MITKLKANRFRIRRPEFPAPEFPAHEFSAPADEVTATGTSGEGLFDTFDDGFGPEPFPTADAADRAPRPPTATDAGAGAAADTDIDAIRQEGLTARQLRLARRVAQRHGLPAISDLDAVRQLRKAGIDPFQRGSVLELVLSGNPAEAPAAYGAETETSSHAGARTPARDQNRASSRALTTTPETGARSRMPQPARPARPPTHEQRTEVNHAAEILKVQKDMARRRRRKSALLAVRLTLFVGLPTFLCAWYFYVVASPLYATKSELIIQQSQSPGAAASSGLGGLLQGSPMATQQDSIAVQGYLQSREAMLRLDADHGFRAHFSDPGLDPVIRLAPDASNEAVFRTYQRNIQISYDPTEGLIRLQVNATDPATSAGFARALIGYAEGQVDQLTQRLREDQMQGARDSYVEAEAKMIEAQRRVVELQEQYKVLSSEVEVSLITTQVSQLETMLTQDRLSLEQMESNASPNLSRMEPLKRRIATLESEIAMLRAKLTEDGADGLSIARVQGELLMAEADVQTRQLILAQSLQSMETARVEANRQVRYLSVAVSPVPPDEATYPRAFESSMVAMMIFAGIYLMISMTVAILNEQVSA